MVELSTLKNHRFSDALLVVFTRFPIAGKAKTRLIPALGAEGAANHQKMMTEFIIAQARKTGVHIEVRFTDGTTEQMRNWLGTDIYYKEQGTGDLGERMSRAISENLNLSNNSIKRVGIIGSDCPDFRSSDMIHFFTELENNPVVIGPALDGGYYTIGMRKLQGELFSGIDWGTEKVLEQTLKIAKTPIKLLQKLSDVDELHDLVPKISVIIPSLNEEKTIQKTIESAKQGYFVEIIVSDGGSSDKTKEIAESLGVKVVSSKQGRGQQQQAGFEASSGELIVLLHADTILPENWDKHVRTELKNENTAITAFKLAINESGFKYKLVSFFANLRSQWAKLPYGDQAFAIRKTTLLELGGIPKRVLMEDVYLVRKAQKLGNLSLIPASVKTSARRWKKYGVIKTTVFNQLILWADSLGASDIELKNVYYADITLVKLLVFCLRLILGKNEK